MNDLTMNIPTEIVERAVRDKINAAIASQLGDPEILITKMVGVALRSKVNSQGNVSNSTYDNRFEFLEQVSGNFIREAATEALKEYFEENKNKIKEAVKKEVARSPSKFAKVFMDGITDSMNARFSNTVNISFNSKDDY